ncbi:MAG TPA: efflux RND transporter periplasmic adaptor subunit [Thermoanaerobaculia bacterium]|nr:efflux RND transporter periplasmic adaptor subunit [Thermoanaerobaculia bacterium]
MTSQESPRPADLSALRIHREPEHRPGGTRGWLLLAAILVVAVGAAAYVVAGRGLRATKVEVVTAAVVTEGQATTVLTATGYVEAERKADLSPKITSRITRLNVTEGTRVRKDEIIAKLDSTDLDAQLAEAKANWVNAENERVRQKNLYEQGLSPKSTYDAAVASEAATRARVHYTEALLDYTIIRAPFTGVITAKRAFVGEAVSPFGASPSGGGSGGAIATIVEFSSLYVGADINESNLSRLKPEQPAEILLDAVPDRVYHGRLRQIVPAADRQKATVRVKVAFLDPDDHVLPDLSARVSFTSEPTQGKEARSRVVVPKAAIATVDGKTGVYRIVDGRAVFTPVTAGGDVQGQVEIKQGLSGGERLISLSGGVRIQNGDKVRAEGQES